MPSRKQGVWIDGKFYDQSNLPAWYEDVRPAVGTYDDDGKLHVYRKSLTEAEENAVRNQRGSEFTGRIIFFIGLAWVIVLVVLLALVFGD